MSKPILGYWDIRGLAEPIRLVYHYLDIDFEDKRYSFGPAPVYDREHWLNDKFNLGLDFPNLPYLFDGDVKLTQSNVILRYLARKYNLGGETEEQKQRVELCEQQVYDLRIQMALLVYFNPNYENQKVTYLENLPKSLQLLSSFLGERQYVVGDKLTYADFMLYDYLDFQRLFEPGALENFDNLKQFVERIEAIPAIAEYIKSDKFPKNRVWGPMATWHGPKE